MERRASATRLALKTFLDIAYTTNRKKAFQERSAVNEPTAIENLVYVQEMQTFVCTFDICTTLPERTNSNFCTTRSAIIVPAGYP